MKATFITELLENSSIVVLEQRVHLVSQRASDRPAYIRMGGAVRGLVESDMVVDLENILMNPILEIELNKLEDQHKREIAQWDSDIANVDSRRKMDKIQEFLWEFMQLWPDSKYAGQTSRETKKVEFDYTESFHPHRKSVVPNSVFPWSAGFYFDAPTRTVYKLTPVSVQRGRSMVVLDNQTFALSHYSTVEEFESSYIRALSKSVAAILGRYKKKHIKNLQVKQKEYEEFQKSVIPQQTPAGTAGWYYDGSEYYVYIFRKNPYEVRSNERDKVFRFPSCTIGIRVNTSGSISSDNNFYFLSARQIKQGREVGEWVNLKGTDFPHPAVSTMSSDSYPDICLGGLNIAQPSRGKSLAVCLRDALMNARRRITDPASYFDSVDAHTQGRGSLHNYLDYEPELFRNNEVR